MIITKHRDREFYSTPKTYKATCSCGCEFYLNEFEFTSSERQIDGARFINCPECGKVLSSKQMETFPFTVYLKLKGEENV